MWIDRGGWFVVPIRHEATMAQTWVQLRGVYLIKHWRDCTPELH